jgi:hypothetical protein
MKNIILSTIAIAVLALALFMISNRDDRQLDSARPTVGTAPMPTNNRSGAGPSIPAASATTGRTNDSIEQPDAHTRALIAELRPKVDAALRASDFQAADRHVDEVLATPGLEPLEKQRLMVVKMGTRGMRGDHAAMLALMDEIIAVAPDSPLSAQLRRERPQIEKIQRLGPNHPELCETCGQMHAPGEHPADKAANEPQD